MHIEIKKSEFLKTKQFEKMKIVMKNLDDVKEKDFKWYKLMEQSMLDIHMMYLSFLFSEEYHFESQEDCYGIKSEDGDWFYKEGR